MENQHQSQQHKFPKLSLHLRKGFFSMLFVIIGIVFVWRGIWNLMDKYFFPDNPIVSNVVGLVIGLVILYLPDQDIKELV